MGYSKWKGSVPDVILQKETENHKFTFISAEINAWNTFWNISKLTILCSEKPFSKNSYYTESQMICNAKQLAGSQTIHIFSERYFQIGINLFPANVPFKHIRLLVFTSKMFEKKHLWQSDILSKDAGHWPVSLLKRSLYHRYFSLFYE